MAAGAAANPQKKDVRNYLKICSLKAIVKRSGTAKKANF